MKFYSHSSNKDNPYLLNSNASPDALKSFKLSPALKRKIIMRINLCILFIVVGLIQVSAAGFAQKITLKKQQAPLTEIFKDIQAQSGYDFVFSNRVIATAHKVTIDVNNASIEETLKLCFRDQPFSYTIENKTIVVKKNEELIPDQIKTAPTIIIPITISGRVTDSLNTPLIGASVYIKSTNKGVVTDDKGEFSLSAQVGDPITITFIGFQPFNFIATDNLSFQNIVLHTTSSKLSEVVVSTGYQTLPKERATGSFATVDNQLFNREVSPDVLSRLEGNVPGLLFNHTTAASANGGYDINIRGHSTLFSNDQPLIVVDNFAYDGDLTSLNPNDVESITVLKDAAAASIWGVRSGNGVIVITTKKGKRNQKLLVGLNANITVGNKPNLFYNPNFLDANDYINIEQKLFSSGYYDGTLTDPIALVSPVVQILANQRSGSISSADATSQINALRTNDVRNDLTKYFYQKSVNQQYAVNFSGGGINSDYYFSMGEDNDLSNQVGNSNNRITIKSSYNFYPIKNLQLSAGINYIQSNARNNSSVAFQSALQPYSQLVSSNGTALPISTDYSPAFKASMTNSGFLDWQYKPYNEITLDDNTTKSIDNLLNFGAKYTIVNGFNAEVKYQYENSNSLNQIDNSINTYHTRNLINLYTQVNSNGSLSYPIPLGGILSQNDYILNSQQLRGQLNYNHDWNSKHELSAIAGMEVRGATVEGNGNVAYGYDKSTANNVSALDFADTFPLTAYGSAKIPNGQSFSKTTNNFISYFSNAAYTYLNRYTVSVSGRIDHSNLFGVNTNQKAVPLYSAGISWNLSKEKFYDISWLPVLKPRITYGYTANINTSAAAVTTLLQHSNSIYSGNPYETINTPGNPELRWEKVRTTNFGLDFNFKNNIISGSVEYYLKDGIDLFGSSPLAPTTGLTSFYGNTANTAGRGADIVINTRNIDNQTFKWTTNFIFSYVLDKVTNYDVKSTALNLLATGDGNSYIDPVVGRPEFGIYSYKWAGLNHSTGDPQGYVNGKPSTDYATIINNSTVDSLQFNGPSRPTKFGSLRNSFSFKQLTFSFNISYKFDYYFRRSSMSDVSGVANGELGGLSSDYSKAWQKPGDEAFTNVPSIQYPPFTNGRGEFYAYSSALVDKGDNIRIQDININYDWDKSQWKKLPFAHLQVYGYINNVGILWRANKDHLDPDQYAYSGLYYPTPRTFALGVKATF